MSSGKLQLSFQKLIPARYGHQCAEDIPVTHFPKNILGVGTDQRWHILHDPVLQVKPK